MTKQVRTPVFITGMATMTYGGLWHFLAYSNTRFMCGRFVGHGSRVYGPSRFYEPDSCCKTCHKAAQGRAGK